KTSENSDETQTSSEDVQRCLSLASTPVEERVGERRRFQEMPLSLALSPRFAQGEGNWRRNQCNALTFAIRHSLFAVRCYFETLQWSFHFNSSISSLYPTPWTVLIQRGDSGSCSIFLRRLATWLSTVRVVGNAA